MSAAQGLVSVYASVALLLTAGAGLLRLALAGAARLGMPLTAGQVLRAGRATLALAVLLPGLGLAMRGLAPAAPLFDFDRSVARYAGRLPAPTWTAPVRAGRSGQVGAPAAIPLGAAAGLVLAVSGAVGAWHLRRHWRLLRRLEALPRMRQVGRVAIVVSDGSDSDATAFSAWFPRWSGPTAWVVVPAALLEDPTGLRLTVLHELQHHRQRDTVLAYARLALGSLFFWNPAVHAFGRWLAGWQELACDEALVLAGRVRPTAYATCLLRASLRASPALPAAVVGMAHPTLRRIEMLFQYRPARRFRAAAPVVAVALALTPLALWAQSASSGREVTLAQAQALAAASNPPGDLAVVVDAQVVEQVNRLVATPKGRAFMRKALDNLTTQREALASTLRARGLPEGLLAVAVIESAVSNLPETSREPSLAPGMRGAGVWMFIPETARRYGLTVSADRDERLDVARETDAAATYLSALFERYHDWRLALAAYNLGERRVDKALAEGGTRDPSELARAGLLNDYASTVMAGLLVLRNPRLLE